MFKNKFILYFKSKAFIFMVSLFFGLIGLGLLYDHIFGVYYVFPNVRTIDDLTTGDVITAGGVLAFILLIVIAWVIDFIREQKNEHKDTK